MAEQHELITCSSCGGGGRKFGKDRLTCGGTGRITPETQSHETAIRAIEMASPFGSTRRPAIEPRQFRGFPAPPASPELLGNGSRRPR